MNLSKVEFVTRPPKSSTVSSLYDLIVVVVVVMSTAIITCSKKYLKALIHGCSRGTQGPTR